MNLWEWIRQVVVEPLQFLFLWDSVLEYVDLTTSVKPGVLSSDKIMSLSECFWIKGKSVFNVQTHGSIYISLCNVQIPIFKKDTYWEDPSYITYLRVYVSVYIIPGIYM